MKELVEAFRKDIPKALESSEYESRRTELLESYQTASNDLFQGLEKGAEKVGFSLQRTVSGLVIVPQKAGRNYTQEEYDDLNDKKRQKLEKQGKELTEQLNEVLRQVREQEKITKDALAQADRDLGMSCLGHRLDPLREKYGDQYTIEEVKEAEVLNIEKLRSLWGTFALTLEEEVLPHSPRGFFATVLDIESHLLAISSSRYSRATSFMCSKNFLIISASPTRSSSFKLA